MSTKSVDIYERKVAILTEDLRLWILSQPHLNSRIEDEFLRGFLRCCQYDLSATKIRLDSFYTLKTGIPSVMTERNVNQKLLDICQIGIGIYLPVSLKDRDFRINFSKYPSRIHNNSMVFKYSDLIKLFFMSVEVNMIESRNLESQQAAIIYVIDMKEATFKESLQIDFAFSKKVLQFTQQGLPLQLDEVHFINVSRYFICILRILCSFLNVDLKKKLFIHNSMDSFYKYIPQKFLPAEYGGKNGNMKTCIRKQIENLLKFEQYFEEDDIYGVNESLRRKIQ
ncbi:clavesin-1-like [Eupeodes corollae]|uniref:clavesin-1-like n=1 Tax=Eupeodes corollae TaxID=290404 RepID=UPI002492689E|nr:clavesin-1-like [Eupeodes corollae]